MRVDHTGDAAVEAVQAGGGAQHDGVQQDLPGLGETSTTQTPVARHAVRVHPAASTQFYKTPVSVFYFLYKHF